MQSFLPCIAEVAGGIAQTMRSAPLSSVVTARTKAAKFLSLAAQRPHQARQLSSRIRSGNQKDVDEAFDRRQNTGDAASDERFVSVSDLLAEVRTAA